MTRTASATPTLAASAAIFRGDDVLLIQRGDGAYAGRWSLPGGHVEPGETVRAAALREVGEETGITAALHGFVDLHEVILREADGAVRRHYVIAVFAGSWVAGEPAAGGDAARARFYAHAELAGLDTTPGALEFIARARTLVAAAA